MTECCGKERSTPFCPICGKGLGPPGPLTEVLAYCRDKEKINLGIIEKWQKYLDAEEGSNEYCTHRVELSTVAAARWKSWGDALAELIARTTEESMPT